MKNRKDCICIGRRFGRWIVRQTAGIAKNNQLLYFCDCDCGESRIVIGYDLVYGKSKSCGCLSKDMVIKRLTTHNLSGTRIHGIWLAMKGRCYCKNHIAYKNYGGRGITVCPSWKNSFERFYKDMKKGYKEHLTIDRIDNDGPYCPFNCRWLTRQENYLNSSRIKHITLDGVTKTLTEWLIIFKTTRATYGNRVYRYGWSPEEALITKGTKCSKAIHY
jgi:hypothetical protein